MSEPIKLYDLTLKAADLYGSDQALLQKLVGLTTEVDKLGITSHIEGFWQRSQNSNDTTEFDLVFPHPVSNTQISAPCKISYDGSDFRLDPHLELFFDSRFKSVTISVNSSNAAMDDNPQIPISKHLTMIIRTIAYLKLSKTEVIFNAEHFFDGYKHDPFHTLQILQTAVSSGADWIVFCDTNGGCLPSEVRYIINNAVMHLVRKIKPYGSIRHGILAHNNCGLALANSLAAIEAGAGMVQASINGIGNHCSHANLVQIITHLQTNLSLRHLPGETMEKLTEMARITENMVGSTPQPMYI